MSRVNNIIKTRRKKELIIKMVCTGVNIANDLSDELNDYMDMHKESVTKMETLYGLTKVSVSAVNHNVFITYSFEREKEAKDFELSFVKYIDNDGNNITESFLITEPKTEEDNRDEFEVILALPETAVKILKENKTVRSLTLEGYPTTPIYGDMVPVNNKKVRLLSSDFDLPIVQIFFYSGRDKIIRTVPQAWLDIKELTYKALINTAWATTPSNIVKFSDEGVHAKKGDTEIIVPLHLVQLDGKTVTLTKDNEEYIDVLNEKNRFTKELLIFK